MMSFKVRSKEQSSQHLSLRLALRDEICLADRGAEANKGLGLKDDFDSCPTLVRTVSEALATSVAS